MLSHVQQTSLPNNLRIIKVPMDTPSATALVLFGTGSRYESEKIAGISHFLEHMMFKGTKRRPTSLELVQEVDGLGGEYNAYTSKDHTGYYIKAAATHLPKVIDILSDMTLNSLLKQEEIDRERGVIIQEMMMYEDTPLRRIEEEYEKFLYGENHPLGRLIIGSKDTVRSVMHEDFASYMKTFYRPSNAVIVLAGGGLEHIDAHIEKHFSSWTDSTAPAYTTETPQSSKTRLKLIHKKTEQTHLCIGTSAYSRTDDRRYALNILMAILGGGMSSRLFYEIRERRGLAYYVRSWANKYQDTGNIVTQAGVETAKLTDAVSVMMAQFNNISKKGYRVPKEEIVRAKEYMKGHIILSMEDSMSVAQFIGNAALLDGKMRTLQQTLDAIDKVSADDIYAVADDLFVQNKLKLAVIGPISKKVEKELNDLIQ